MASSEDLYSLAYQQALAESQPAEDLALKYDAVSPYMKKLLNSVRTADVLMKGVTQHKLEKQANMDGYRKGYILFDENSDADSGTAIDAETGEAFNYRFNAFNQYDAGDKLESVLKSPSKSWNQPQFVLKMYGLQNFDGLTEEQKGALFTNVKNYHFQQMRNSLLDPNYKGEKFDPDTIYAAPTRERIEFMYKNTGGLDRYNRYLIDAINPTTGRSVVFDTAQNPYLNEKFDFYKAINSDKNIKRLERWEKQGDIISNTSFTTPTQAIQNYRDNTSLLGQTYDKFDYAVDLAKSSFVGEFTKFISSDRAKKMGVDKVFDVEGWKKLDERLEKENQTGIRGQIFTAVNKEADKFYENMQKEWGKGNYFASAKNALGFLADYIGMMPELIGQSAGQTGVGVAIGAAAGSAIPGAGTAGGAMLGLAASVLGQGAYTALSNTLDTLENFKKNNGKEMSWDETLQTFGEYLGAATYEAGLDRVFLGRLFGRSKLGQKLFGKPSKILEGKNSLQAGGLAALSEIPQEGWESTIDAYHSQKEGSDRLSRFELATSPEVVKQAIGGGVAGFGMGAGLTGLSRLGTGRARKALEQDIAKQQQYNEAKTITGSDADVEASNDFLSNLKPTSFDDKIANLQSSKITPEAAHAEAEKIRTTLDNTDTAYNRNAYYAGTQEANQWDLAAAQYYKDQGLSNDEIEQKLGVNLEDLFGNVIQGSNLNSRRLYEQGMQLDDAQYQAEEERLKKVGEDLGLDKDFIESAIENVNENVRYGGAGYHTYSDRVMNNLNRLKTESLTPESKQLLETEVTDNLTGMFRIYTDQAHKVSELMHAAEKLAATNERQADTSWMHRNKAFTVNRANLANGSYNSKSGVYAIFRNAVEDLRTIEAKTNDLIKAGVPAELIQNAMEAVSKETDHPRKMAPWGIADSLEIRFKNAALSLKTQARDQSKFSGKDFSVDDLTSSLTYLTKSTDKTKDSAKYNQAFQNLHYAFTQKPEVVDALKTKVNGWKNEALKQKALGEIDRIAAYRDEIGTESEARKAQHDPYVKNMKATLDEIDKLYVQDSYDESGETNESRMQKLRKQTGYLDRLQKLRANFQAVIDTNSKEDIALRDHLDKTIGEVQKKIVLFSSNRSGQETGKGKFKDNVKNFISSIKRLANKKVLETQLKSLQKKYDDGVLKGHSDELLGEIQAKITAVQNRLNELNNQEEPKPNPKLNETTESASETATEEEPEEEEDFLVQEIKKSTDISWLESTRDNLAASNPNDHRVSRYTELINKRIEEVKTSDTKKPTRTAFNASYNYGEYNSLRNDPVFVALVSAIINDSSIAPNVTFKRISYFLSDEFEAKLKDKNLSEKELKKFQKELVRLTEAITEIKNGLSNKNNKGHIDKLLDKVVQKILPKLQKDYNRQVREAYKEAKSELEKSTIWRLAKGEYGKISYDSLVKVTDKKTANALRKKLPKLIVKEGGLSLDLIASNTDNDLGQAEKAFEGDPSKVAEMLYQTIVVDEKTINGEARKQAQDSAKAEEAKLETFKENPKSILYGHLNRLLQAMDMRLQNMDQVISGDARISRQDGSGSTGRGGDGNSSTTPSGSDSTASQAPNSEPQANLSQSAFVMSHPLFIPASEVYAEPQIGSPSAFRQKYFNHIKYVQDLTAKAKTQQLTKEELALGSDIVAKLNKLSEDFYFANEDTGKEYVGHKSLNNFIADLHFNFPGNDKNDTIENNLKCASSIATHVNVAILDFVKDRGNDSFREMNINRLLDDINNTFNKIDSSKLSTEEDIKIYEFNKKFVEKALAVGKQLQEAYKANDKSKAPAEMAEPDVMDTLKTPQNGSQNDQNGQGVQTPTPTPQGSQNGSQRPSQGSQEQPLNVWYGTGENAQFSNLAERPFTYENHPYLTVEHAYQTLKSGTFDAETYEKPWKEGVKFVGKKGTNKEINAALMRDLIRASFDENPRAKAALIATGTTPFTHNNSKVDAFWQKEFPAALDYVRTYFSNQPGPNAQVVSIRSSGYGKKTDWVTNDTYYIYGGRNGDTSNKYKLGNPYELGSMSREEAIDRCWSDKEWLAKVDAFIADMKAFKAENPKLKKIILGCWCAPDPCHLNLVAKRIQTEVFGDVTSNTQTDNNTSINTNINQNNPNKNESKPADGVTYNKWTKEAIEARIQDDKQNTYINGTQSLLTTKEITEKDGKKKTISTRVVGWMGYHQNNKGASEIPFELTRQIKEVNGEAESYLAYNYHLLADQIDPLTGKTYIESIREYAERIKFDPKQINKPNPLLYFRSQSLTEKDKENDKTNEESELVFNNSILAKFPAFRLLYDIDGVFRSSRGEPLVKNYSIKFNDFTLTLVDFSLREYLTNSDYDGYFKVNQLTDEQIANMFGEDIDLLTPHDLQDLRSTISNYGIPRSVMINALGALILRNMGIVENKKSSNYGFFSSLTASIGAWAVDYGEQRGLYKLTEFNPPEGHYLSKDKNKNKTIHLLQIDNTHKERIAKLQESFQGTVESTDNLGKRTRKPNGLNQFKNSKANLSNDPVWDNREISYTNEDTPVYVKNSGNLSEVSMFRRKVMEKMANVKYRFDTDITDFLDEKIDGVTGWDLLAKTMGYTDKNELQFLSADEQESVKGRNLDIQKQINALKDGIEKQRELLEDPNSGWSKDNWDTGIRFKQFWSKNGRIFIDSSSMNPQTMKLLRFTCLAEGMHYDFDPNDKTQIKVENYAIAQAFDKLASAEKTDKFAEAMKSLSIDNLKLVRKLLISNSAKKFEKAIEKLAETNEAFKVLGETGIGVESIPQCLNALTHLIRRQEANGKKFNTSLVVENDSTTSGYVIKMLQMPLTSIKNLEKLLEKVGVTFENNANGLLTIHELKKTEGFNDLYRTTASEVSDYIDKLLSDKGKIMRDKVFSKDIYPGDRSGNSYPNHPAVKFLNETFLDFKEALPKKTLKGTISGAFRTLMKPATMVFGYSAGIKSISNKLAGTVLQDYVNVYTVLNLKYEGDIAKYVKESGVDYTEQEVAAIQRGMQAIAEKYTPTKKGMPASFLEAIQKYSYHEIQLALSDNAKQPYQISLENCFQRLIGNTYGKAAGEALEKIFKPYVDINNRMIEMTNTAAHMYKQIYEYKFNQLIENARKSNKTVSNKDVEKLRKELKNLQPYLNLADDNTTLITVGNSQLLEYANTSQMALTKFDKDRSTFNLGASYYLKDGNAVSNSYAFGYERTPAYPERAGAVIPIHCLDGAIMADIMDRYAQEGMLGIHDAIVMSAFKSEGISKYYNQRLALRCKEYNVFNDIYNNFTRVTNEFEKICNKDPELKDMFLKYGIKNYELTGGNGLPIVRKPIYANGIHVDDEYKTISDLLEGYTVTRRKNLGGGKYAYVDVYTKGVIETDEDISRSRAYLDSLTYRVANLDTATNAGVYIYSDSSTLVEQGLRGSSPNSYQTNGAINNIYHKALDDPEERANIVDYVQNLAASLGNKLCSDKHVARLKELVRSIAPERVKGVALDIADNGRWTAGQYDPSKKHIQLVMDDKSASRLLDSKTKLCVLSLLAPAEIYAHEVLHAGNEFAFTHRGVFGFNSQIRKLLVIQEEAKKVITWKDFMPADGTFDESLRPYYERHARAFHNYIFVEQDPKTLASLNEFCSFVATNENLRAKLANVTINQPTMNPNANLVDRLIVILKGMYDVIFSKKKFSEVFTRTYKVLKGDSTGKTVSLLDEFDRLHRQLHTANHKAVNSLFAQPMKYFETFLSVTDELVKSGNEKIHGYLHKMFNFHEIKRDEALAKAQEARLQNDDAKEKAYIEEASKHIPQVNIATNATKWEITKELGKLAKTIVTSSEARKNMRMIMRDLTRTSQQGLWMSTYRDFMGPDEGTSIFEALGMRLRMVDKISKNQEATAMKVLQDAFGRPLNDYENTALANAFLYTDAQSLYDGQNLGEVVSFLKDPNLRKQNISQILDTFKQKLSPRDYSWLQYSAVSTAYHMVHSIGNPLLNLNAKNIAEGRGWDHSLNLTDAEIAQLDKLITLYALDNTSQEFLDVTATLPAKGIEQFLKMHKEFVDESKHGYKDVSDSGQVVVTPFMEATNVMKGYTKTMTDPSIESVIAVPDATDPEAMKKQGYDDKMTLTADGIVNSKDAHVYTRFGIPNRRDGNTVSVQGHNAIGKTLMQFAFSEEDQLDIKNGLSRDDETRKREAIKRWRAMRKKADDNLVKLRNDVIAASKNNKEFTFDDIGKIINQYSSFSPIYNDKVAGPADYRQTLARDIKRQHLGLDERGLTILSRMFGSVTRQIYGAGANKVLLEFTKDYMKKNMNFMSNMDMQGHKFVKIEKDSPNKYLRESWKVIPENFKEYAKNNTLYIREDWLQDYFGVSNYTLLDNDKVKRHTGYLVKRSIAIAEMIMKTIAYARKQAIVLKIPGVLVGNIVSNLMFSIMNHRNPIKVIKTTIANAQAIRDYIENRKTLDRILFKTRLGTITAEETSQIPALRRKIENNIVKPLMEKGMYQSIIEDMQSDELESIGKVNKWLKHNKIAQKLPPSVKNTFKTVFMMEGTPAYDFMFIATQYSDFIARCTEYQLSMDEVPAEYERAKKKGTTKETLSQFMERREKEISTMITNAFINYDKPQSKFEQYMNDLGLIMFSKFGKRIQSVIKNQLYHRPIHALLFLMSQVTFIDTEDILEQNLFSKNWLNLMHSPIDNFIGAAIPMPIQIMFGDQKAF